MGLGQYDSLGEYCDPHTASSVLLILVPTVHNVEFGGGDDGLDLLQPHPPVGPECIVDPGGLGVRYLPHIINVLDHR